MMKTLRPSANSEFTLGGSLLSLLSAEDDADRRSAYERERERLEAIARAMMDRNCPQSDLQRAHTRK